MSPKCCNFADADNLVKIYFFACVAAHTATSDPHQEAETPKRYTKQ